MAFFRFGLHTTIPRYTVYISLRHIASQSKVAPVSPRVRELLDRLLRVDHAGEYGAVRIYQGQLDVLGRTKVGPVISVGLISSYILDRGRGLITSFVLNMILLLMLSI